MAREALSIDRRLARTNPAFQPQFLSSSLKNMGARLSDLGRREEALLATREAVAIERRLAITPAV